MTAPEDLRCEKCGRAQADKPMGNERPMVFPVKWDKALKQHICNACWFTALPRGAKGLQ